MTAYIAGMRELARRVGDNSVRDLEDTLGRRYRLEREGRPHYAARKRHKTGPGVPRSGPRKYILDRLTHLVRDAIEVGAIRPRH